MIALIVLLGVLIIAYFMLYFGSRKYLETFETRRTGSSAPFPPAKPYALQPIDRLDDYEMSMIFQNEGTKEASKQQIRDAMSQYPLDWSTQGQNSQRFQEGQAAYEQTAAAKKPMRTQQDANEESMLLPDHVQQDEEEKKILQTYQPTCTKGLLEYCADDVKALVDRVYGRKGLLPVVEKSSQGQNIWEIVEVKEKNPKIVWEDEDPAQERRDIMASRGEEVITVPYPASDLAAGLDPFFQTGSSSRTGKHDYTKWTPGLERMYAPTYPIKSWF
jgi:hypothetical protein